MEGISTDILIIGGGLAAMMAALEVSGSSVSVLVASKAKIGESGASLMAGSNFAAVLPEAEEKGDQIPTHVADTLSAGAYINEPELVQVMAERAPQDLLYMETLGIQFIKRDGRFDLRQPPGHRNLRTVFTVNPGYPLTIRGKSFTVPLRQRILEKGIPFRNGLQIFRLIVRDGKIQGALGVQRQDGKFVAIECKAVIIASGGGSFLFARNTNPSDVTGDSYSLALEAGCLLRDMEFVQFYPCMYLGSPRVNIYSPILSDGAVLRNKDGERFLSRYEPERMEMATRDAVSQAIFREIRDGKGVDGGVYMDLTAIPRDLLAFRFPDLLAFLTKVGIDPHKDWIRVTPAAHFFMGGIVIDRFCQTSVQGLFAAGEAAGGIHGANRLSGNGLSDPLVFGRIAGQRAIQYAQGFERTSVPDAELRRPWKTAGEKISRKRIEELRAKIKQLMWEKVGIVRNGPELVQAMEQLGKWQNLLEEGQPESPEDFGAYLEVRSMLIASRAVASSALFREESRGAHFREDYPALKKEWGKSVFIRLDGGNLYPSGGR